MAFNGCIILSFVFADTAFILSAADLNMIRSMMRQYPKHIRRALGLKAGRSGSIRLLAM